MLRGFEGEIAYLK